MQEKTPYNTFRLTNGSANGDKFSPKLYKNFKSGSKAKIKTYNLQKKGAKIYKGSRIATGVLGGYSIYEGYEQYYKQTQKDPYIKAHAKATNIESIISNVKIEIDREFYEDEWENGNISVFFRDNDAKRKSVFISYKKRNNLIVK